MKPPHEDNLVDQKMAAVLRALPGGERLRMAHEAWALARMRLDAFLRFQHPTWSEQCIAAEIARRLSSGSGATLPVSR